MFLHELERAASTAPRTRLPEISRTIWRAYAENLLGETDAQRLAELVESRKALPPTQREPRKPARPGSRPKSAESLARRRRWVASGKLPPALAAGFTMGEQAVLAVVASEVIRRGDCRMAVGHIAALAGVCATTVRNALRQAAELGIVTVTERRLTMWRNDTNVVAITSAEWRSWLRLRPAGGGCKSVVPTTTKTEQGPSRLPPPQESSIRTSMSRHVRGAFRVRHER